MKLIKSAWLLLIVLVSGCASGPTVVSNSDPDVDFTTPKSFSFMQPLSTDRDGVRTLMSTQLMTATTRELEKRGWKKVMGNPDVLVNFLFETQEQIRSRNTTASMGMHRSGRYGMWGGTVSTPTVEQVTRGALSIDMIDPLRNQLIWEGTATDRVTDRIRNNQEAAVNNFVAEIFVEFPGDDVDIGD